MRINIFIKMSIKIYMNFIKSLLSVFYILAIVSGEPTCNKTVTEPNSCIQFTVSSGTGCAWMCSYCANQLGTNNYYFPDGVCSYQSGGCVGNPIAGKQYSCCSA